MAELLSRLLPEHVSYEVAPNVARCNSATEQCIDLQYLRATQNNPVGLYNCAGLGNTGAADKGINWPLANVTTAMMFSA
jgi:hypothetical protein